MYQENHAGWKRWLLMVACCLPMIAIIALLSLGYWNFH